MKDLDPGRSGREDYNPETEGKPADRDRGGDIREPDRGAPTDPSRTRPGSTDDELNDEDSALERGKSNRGVDEDFEDPDRDQ